MMYHHGEKMSGLKQKEPFSTEKASPKTLEEKAKTSEEIKNTTELEITRKRTSGITFPRVTDKWVRLADAEEEISYYKKMANKYTKETYLLKEEIEKLKEDNTKIHFLYEQAQAENNKLVDCCERLGQIREHTKNFPMLDEDEGYPFIDKNARRNLLRYISKVGVWRKKLVGCLGKSQKLEREFRIK